jgi:hypothetical protein
MKLVQNVILCLLLLGPISVFAGQLNGSAKASFLSELVASKDVTCGQTGAIQCGGTVSGMLDLQNDCAFGDGTVFDQYAFNGTAGQEITVNLTSPNMDTFLFLFDPALEEEARDDDGGTGTNSRLTNHVLASTGQYLLLANTFGPEEGNYQMSLDCETNGGGGGFPVDEKISGTWFDPSHDGEGWKIEIINDTTAVIYWFTYPPPGANLGKQSWMVAVGTIDGDTITVDEVTITGGPSFGPNFDPNAVDRDNWGSFSMTFSGMDAGSMTYDGGPAGFGTGTFNLARLTGISALQGKGDLPDNVGSGISGTWFDPTHDGEGWLIEVIDPITALVYWFTYDDQGRQAWNLGVGNLKGNQIVVKQPVEAEGTEFGSTFNPNDVVRTKWGGYVFTFTDCNNGRMSYGNQKGLGFGDFEIVRLTAINNVNCTAFNGDLAPDNTLGVNPGDPLVLKSKRKDGHEAEFFGQKSGTGVPQNLSTIKVKDPLERIGSIMNDDQNRPTQITDDEDGDILGISYTEDPNNIVLSGLTLSGKLQALLAVGFGPGGGKAVTRPIDLKRRDGRVHAWVSEVPAMGGHAKSNTASVIDVSQCGTPVDNAVVDLRITAAGQSFDIPGIPIGNGQYQATIPTRSSSQGAVSGQTSCQTFINQVDNGCDTLDRMNDEDIPGICRALAETMASNLPMNDDLDTNLEAAVDLLESCAFSLYAAKLACNSGGGRAVNRNNFVCNNVVEEVDRALEDLAANAIFRASARLPGSSMVDSQTDSPVPTSGPFPDFQFLNDDDVSITDFFTDPVDPAEFESYVATARISCAGTETNVLMTITGTDGFTDSDTCVISGSGDCNLQVPGAAAGVEDTITVEVENGPTRQIQIVF